jgi:hypothetical protein
MINSVFKPGILTLEGPISSTYVQSHVKRDDQLSVQSELTPNVLEIGRGCHNNRPVQFFSHVRGQEAYLRTWG